MKPKYKPGRKRQAGERYPSGDRILATPIAHTQIKRAIGLLMVGASDPSLACQLGWLRVEKVITDKQVEAGLRLATLVGQHDAMMGFPQRSTKSPSYEMGFSGAKGLSHDDLDDERIILLRKKYGDAIKIIHDAPTGSNKIATVVLAVCVDDRSPGWNERPILDIGLNVLAHHFGLLTNQQK